MIHSEGKSKLQLLLLTKFQWLKAELNLHKFCEMELLYIYKI